MWTQDAGIMGHGCSESRMETVEKAEEIGMQAVEVKMKSSLGFCSVN